jgi:hypothetical protein
VNVNFFFLQFFLQKRDWSVCLLSKLLAKLYIYNVYLVGRYIGWECYNNQDSNSSHSYSYYYYRYYNSKLLGGKRRVLGRLFFGHTERIRLASRAALCVSSLKYSNLNLEIIEEFCKSELSELELLKWFKWLNGENGENIDLRVNVDFNVGCLRVLRGDVCLNPGPGPGPGDNCDNFGVGCVRAGL